MVLIALHPCGRKCSYVAALFFLTLLGVIGPLQKAWSTAAAISGPVRETTLSILDTHFTVNGKPTFLLGFSYYGALGAAPEFVHKDLDDFQAQVSIGCASGRPGILPAPISPR